MPSLLKNLNADLASSKLQFYACPGLFAEGCPTFFLAFHGMLFLDGMVYKLSPSFSRTNSSPIEP